MFIHHIYELVILLTSCIEAYRNEFIFTFFIVSKKKNAKMKVFLHRELSAYNANLFKNEIGKINSNNKALKYDETNFFT